MGIQFHKAVAAIVGQVANVGLGAAGSYFSARREAAEADQQVELVKAQKDRDLRDLKRQVSSTYARQRAVLAAKGQGGLAGSEALLGSTLETGALSKARIETDADYTIASLRAKATNARNSAYGTLALAGLALMGEPGLAVAGQQLQGAFTGKGSTGLPSWGGAPNTSSSYGTAGRASGMSPGGTMLKGSNGMLGGGV